jgi:xanthine dehydrogenase accessory factor
VSGYTSGSGARVTAADSAAAALEAARGGPAVATVLVVTGPRAMGMRMLLWEDGRTAGRLGDERLEIAALDLARHSLRTGETKFETVDVAGESFALFADTHRAPDSLVIVGAGHIAVPLAQLGVSLAFRVTVLDDREEFASPERFPALAKVVRADFETDPFAGVPIDDRTYVALVTRGHRWDYDCLMRLVKAQPKPRYVGMIGSRRRVRAAFRALLKAGVPRAELARVHAPIGLDIGAETPDEIAVSISAELIAFRRNTRPESLAQRERVLDRLLPDMEEHGES